MFQVLCARENSTGTGPSKYDDIHSCMHTHTAVRAIKNKYARQIRCKNTRTNNIIIIIYIVKFLMHDNKLDHCFTWKLATNVWKKSCLETTTDILPRWSAKTVLMGNKKWFLYFYLCFGASSSSRTPPMGFFFFFVENAVSSSPPPLLQITTSSRNGGWWTKLPGRWIHWRSVLGSL